MARQTKKEVLSELIKTGINSASDLNFCFMEDKNSYSLQNISFITVPARISKNALYEEKRTCKRIRVNVEIRFYCWNNFSWKKLYSGTIVNLSKNGMFIHTKNMCFPCDSQLGIFIPFKEKVMYIPTNRIKIVWGKMLSDDSFDGIGIKLSHQHQEYLEFVESFK